MFIIFLWYNIIILVDKFYLHILPKSYVSKNRYSVIVDYFFNNHKFFQTSL